MLFNSLFPNVGLLAEERSDDSQKDLVRHVISSVIMYSSVYLVGE